MASRRAVSVIIPVFNGAPSVRRAVESALRQDYPEFEVVVVDDGSTDDTPRVLERFGGRIRVIRQTNRGLPGARNSGVAASTKEYIAFLDHDDVWKPDKLSKSVASLVNSPASVLAYTDATVVDSNGATVANFVPIDRAHAPSTKEIWESYWPILPSSVVVRRNTYIECGGTSEDYSPDVGWEDVDFNLRARQLGEFQYVPEPLVTYHAPSAVLRAVKYQKNFVKFSRRVREQYGKIGSPLVRSIRDSQVTLLGHAALIAMHRQEYATARSLLSCALRYHPMRIKTMLRLLRTFLPPALARRLSGRTGRADVVRPSS